MTRPLILRICNQRGKMGSMLGDNFVSLEDKLFSSTKHLIHMQINRAHLVWEVGDANTVRRGAYREIERIEMSGQRRDPSLIS
jgi:hypothetical protein